MKNEIGERKTFIGNRIIDSNLIILLIIFCFNIGELHAQSGGEEKDKYTINLNAGIFASTVDEAAGFSAGLGFSIHKEKLSYHINYQFSPEFTIFSEPNYFNEISFALGQCKHKNRMKYYYSGGLSWLILREGGEPGAINLPISNSLGLIANLGLEARLVKGLHLGIAIQGSAYTNALLFVPKFTANTYF